MEKTVIVIVRIVIVTFVTFSRNLIVTDSYNYNPYNYV